MGLLKPTRLARIYYKYKDPIGWTQNKFQTVGCRKILKIDSQKSSKNNIK